MSGAKLAAVIGGSGFVGRHVVRRLAKDGWRVRVGCRRPELAGHLQPMGAVGQIALMQANVRYPQSLAPVVLGADVVINLVGLLQPSGSQTFEAVQHEGAVAVAQAAQAAGVPRFLHMSALGVDRCPASVYAQTKLAAEQGVRALYPDAAVLRPSLVFGPEDDFFNRFAAMARMSPALPLIGGGDTRFQPVFVGDVAEAVLQLANAETLKGLTYELGGPEVKTFKQLLAYVLHITGRRRLLAPLPWFAAELLARFTGFLPNAPLTRDQLELLKVDNVVSSAAQATFHDLGISPQSLEAIVPQYLWRYRATGEFAPEPSNPQDA